MIRAVNSRPGLIVMLMQAKEIPRWRPVALAVFTLMLNVTLLDSFIDPSEVFAGIAGNGALSLFALYLERFSAILEASKLATSLNRSRHSRLQPAGAAAQQRLPDEVEEALHLIGEARRKEEITHAQARLQYLALVSRVVEQVNIGSQPPPATLELRERP